MLGAMSDEQVRVTLVGGPMDGEQQVLPWAAVHEDPHPGTYLIPDSDVKTPEEMPGGRAVYEPRPGEEPTRWHWAGWVR